jgi:hypothetical protein
LDHRQWLPVRLSDWRKGFARALESALGVWERASSITLWNISHPDAHTATDQAKRTMISAIGLPPVQIS